MQRPVTLFVSYAREDSELQKSLLPALAAFTGSGGILEVWSDREIAPGADWDEEINDKIKSCDIIMFLLSADFVHSDYIIGTEYRIAMKRHQEGTATVIPVWLRAVELGDHPLSKLNAIPRDPSASDHVRPLRQWSDPDAFWMTVARHVEATAKQMLSTGQRGAAIEPAETSPDPPPAPEPRATNRTWELRRIAGSGGDLGGEDGSNAKGFGFRTPVAVASVSGDTYIGDRHTLKIHKVDSKGIISGVCNGHLSEQFAWSDMAWESLFFAGGLFGSVHAIDLTTNEVRDIVPPSPPHTRNESSGDDGPATEARFGIITGIAALRSLDPDLMVSDAKFHNVRCVQSRDGGKVVAVAGNGTRGYSGDRGPADKAQLNQPSALAVRSGGMMGESYLYIADTGNHVIRQVRLSDRGITTIAGTGEEGFSGDGGPATEAKLDSPNGIAVFGAGLVISDTGNNRVRLIDGDGTITTIAGTGDMGYPGDARDGRLTDLSVPRGICIPQYGDTIYVCDPGHRRVVTLRPRRY